MTLCDLPDDIFFLVFSHLDAAQHLYRLSLTCRRLYQLVRGAGWNVFLRNTFPFVGLPPSRKVDKSQGKKLGDNVAACTDANLDVWAHTVDAITYQSRCWDRRAIQFEAFLPRTGGRRPRPDRFPLEIAKKHSMLFQPVLDACTLDDGSDTELLVWGEGENLAARYRQVNRGVSRGRELWCHANGEAMGYKTAYDDVCDVALVDNRAGFRHGLAMLVARCTGDLLLQSADPARFGEVMTTFSPDSADGCEHPPRNSLSSVDILRRGENSLVAATMRTSIFLYTLPSEQPTPQLSPIQSWTIPSAVHGSGPAICRAIWVDNGHTLALALKGTRAPLRTLSIRPDGFALQDTAKNANMYTRFGLEDGNVCPNSLVALDFSSLGHAKNGQLLLSAWRDGTCRVQDLRSPSPFDLVYQDPIDPQTSMECLLAQGTERFLAGGLDKLNLKVFDFRWNRAYYHTEGLPCSDEVPFPEPPQLYAKPPRDSTGGRACCDHLRGLRCRWHELSRDVYYRPNANFNLGRGNMPTTGRQSRQRLHGYGMHMRGIWSMTRASDMSPHMYLGISGGLIEATLSDRSTGDKTSPDTQTFIITTAQQQSQTVHEYERCPITQLQLFEIGDGLSHHEQWGSAVALRNCLRFRHWNTGKEWEGCEADEKRRRRNRLTWQFQVPGDFHEGADWDWFPGRRRDFLPW